VCKQKPVAAAEADAADVSFATLFGAVGTGMPGIGFSVVEDSVRGLVAPMDTELAVSTAD
jgi:hypothetical protein